MIMPYTYAEKKRIPGAGSNVAARGGNTVRNIPNSMKINQNPAAEREADEISSGIPASLTPDQLKSALSQRMSADFSGVRFHTGAQAEQSAASIGARAYTQGKDVYFGKGGFDSQIAAHELVHTVQQGAAAGEGTMSMPGGEIQMWQLGKKKKQAAAPANSTATAAPAAAPAPATAPAAAPTAAPAAPSKSFIEKAKEKAAGAKAWLKDKGAKIKTGAGNMLSATGNFIKDSAISTFDAVRNAQDDFHDWRKGVKKKIKNAYEGSALQKGVNTVKGKLGDAGAWVKEKAGKAGNWIKDKAKTAADFVKNSAVGKAVGSAASWTKDKAIKAGGWVKDKAVAAGGWIKDKATTAADYVKNSAVGKAVGSAATCTKDQAIKAGKYIKDSKFGQLVGSAATSVKKGAVGLANTLGEAYGKARSWVGEKKENVKNWFEDKADQVKQHDTQRYLAHKEKKDPGYLKRMQETALEMMQGQIGENIRNRADLEHLENYNEDTRNYSDPNSPAASAMRMLCSMMGRGNNAAASGGQQPAAPEGAAMTDEGKKGWANAGEDLFEGGGSIADFLDDSIDDYNKVKMGIGLTNPKFNEDGEFDYGEFDLAEQGKLGKGISDGMTYVKTAVSARNALKNMYGAVKSAKAGNKQNMAMQIGDVLDNGMSIASDFVDGTPFGLANGAFDIARNGMNYGIHSKQQRDVNKLTKDDLNKGVISPHSQRMINNAQKSFSRNLSVKKAEDVGEIVQGINKVGGKIADLSGAGGIGTAVSKLTSVPIKAVTNAVISRKKKKNDKYTAQEDLFGDRDTYHELKHRKDMSVKDMKILMEMLTQMRSTSDIANAARTEQAQAIHQNIGLTADTGADSLMSAVGYKSKDGRKDLSVDDIREYTGADMSIEDIKRRRRAY